MFQMNPNLLLSPECCGDSAPNSDDAVVKNKKRPSLRLDIQGTVSIAAAV